MTIQTIAHLYILSVAVMGLACVYVTYRDAARDHLTIDPSDTQED